MKKFLTALLVCSGFLFLLCFPKESFLAARDGLLLWYASLVPTLLPFMILSGLLIQTGLAFSLSGLIARPARSLLGLSPGGLYALLVGLLCGCPMGAKTLADLRKANRIAETESIYLATFCNNISPAFLMNYLVLEHLHAPEMMGPTMCILLGAPILYGLFSNHLYRMCTQKCPEALRTQNKTSATALTVAMVDVSISDSILSITKLGGYILLFSHLNAVIQTLIPSSAPLKALLLGIAEISSGIHAAAQLSIPFSCKYLMLIAISSFGGLCCTAQSARMLKTAGLSIRRYLRGRLCITAIALIMAICYVG